MTTLEPTEAMVRATAQERAEGFLWAANRLVELLIEELGDVGASTAVRILTRLQEEGELRQASRNVQANLDVSPHSE